MDIILYELVPNASATMLLPSVARHITHWEAVFGSKRVLGLMVRVLDLMIVVTVFFHWNSPTITRFPQFNLNSLYIEKRNMSFPVLNIALKYNCLRDLCDGHHQSLLCFKELCPMSSSGMHKW